VLHHHDEVVDVNLLIVFVDHPVPEIRVGDHRVPVKLLTMASARPKFTNLKKDQAGGVSYEKGKDPGLHR